MNELEHQWTAYPLSWFGITSDWSAINMQTIVDTWIALIALVVVLCIARYFIRPHKKEPANGPDLSTHAYISYLFKSYLLSFINLVEQTAGTFVYRYFSFTASLFTFILFCNWIALLPFVEEPTKDLNTTFAFGLVTFLYIQKEKIKVHGIVNFLKEYFLPVEIFFPLNVILGIALFPLIALDEIATVVSLSFRLFGNIFGGAIIMQIYTGLINTLLAKLVTVISAVGILGSVFALAGGAGLHLILSIFFVLFEGGLQAFVFAILSLTNITMATAVEGELT